MTLSHLLQIVEVIVIIAGGAQHLDRQVSNDGRGSVIEVQKFPLQTVTGCELTLLCAIDGEVANKFGILDASGANENVSAMINVALENGGIFDRSFKPITWSPQD